MSDINSNTLTKEQLLACLEHDKVNVDADKINEAKNNDGDAFQFIGFIYETEIKDYSKAMEWYQLAINQNNKDAYNDIGCLYYDGLGVSRDYDMSLGYLLKAVGHGDDSAMDNIGFYFLYGHGVPVDKYKALEWYIKYGKKPEQIKALNDKGVHLKEVDKDKTIYQLINETEDIVREKRKKEKQECQDLKKLKSTNEKEIRKLKNQLLREQERINLFGQKGRENINGKKELKQSNDHMAQQLKDKEEIIKSLKREIEGSKKTTEIFEVLVQSKNNESDLLKKDNKRLSDLEQENREEIRELKRRLQEKHQELMSLTDNATTHSPGPSNQDLLANIPNGVTTMVKIEDSDSRSCQAGNKKRKL